jgi:hypothetical protein
MTPGRTEGSRKSVRRWDAESRKRTARFEPGARSGNHKQSTINGLGAWKPPARTFRESAAASGTFAMIASDEAGAQSTTLEPNEMVRTAERLELLQ